MGYELITNGHAYELQRLCDLPKKVARDFDYVERNGDEYEFRFVRYRGAWYDVQDCQLIEARGERTRLPMGWSFPAHPGEPLAQFDCVITDTYFSGVAFRLIDDNGIDCVICAHFYS